MTILPNEGKNFFPQIEELIAKKSRNVEWNYFQDRDA